MAWENPERMRALHDVAGLNSEMELLLAERETLFNMYVEDAIGETVRHLFEPVTDGRHALEELVTRKAVGTLHDRASRPGG